MKFQRQDNWQDAPHYRKVGVTWIKTHSNINKIIYEAVVESAEWAIRMNDFPDEPLYTLIVNGCDVIHFNEWPLIWIRPD